MQPHSSPNQKTTGGRVVLGRTFIKPKIDALGAAHDLDSASPEPNSNTWIGNKQINSERNMKIAEPLEFISAATSRLSSLNLSTTLATSMPRLFPSMVAFFLVTVCSLKRFHPQLLRLAPPTVRRASCQATNPTVEPSNRGTV
jgi:hypothetical protein